MCTYLFLSITSLVLLSLKIDFIKCVLGTYTVIIIKCLPRLVG